MFTLTLTSKGQLTLPKRVRQALKLLPGCTFRASIEEDVRLILVPALHEPEEMFENRPRVRRVLPVEGMRARTRRRRS